MEKETKNTSSKKPTKTPPQKKVVDKKVTQKENIKDKERKRLLLNNFNFVTLKKNEEKDESQIELYLHKSINQQSIRLDTPRWLLEGHKKVVITSQKSSIKKLENIDYF